MEQCLFPVIVQDQRSPNYSNGETGEVMGAYFNGRKCETRGCKDKGDVPFARAIEVFDILERVLQQQSR